MKRETDEEIVGQYRWSEKDKRLTRYQELYDRWLLIPKYIIREMLTNLGAQEYRVVDRLKDIQFTIPKRDLERLGEYKEDPSTKELYLWIDLANFKKDDWSKSDTYLRLQS